MDVVHWTHVFPLQYGVLPEHWEVSVHSTHVPSLSQFGVAGGHADWSMDVQTTHWPVALQIDPPLELQFVSSGAGA